MESRYGRWGTTQALLDTECAGAEKVAIASLRQARRGQATLGTGVGCASDERSMLGINVGCSSVGRQCSLAGQHGWV